jgi:hypothetical protein
MPSSNPEHRRWYGLGAWKKRQKLQMEKENYLCRHCAQRGVVRAATIADHINPNWSTYEDFLTFETQALCAPCHSRKRVEQRLGYRTDIGEDGLPLDKERHPAWQGSK